MRSGHQHPLASPRAATTSIATPPRLMFRSAVWLVPACFALHVLEESNGFTGWAQRHGRPDYSSADFVQINAAGLLLTGAATLAVTRWRGRRLFAAYYALILTQQALFNPVFHVGSTVVYRDWSPGTATAVLLFLPLWWHLTRLALRDGSLDSRGVALAIGAGGVVHGAAVAQQVYGLGS